VIHPGLIADIRIVIGIGGIRQNICTTEIKVASFERMQRMFIFSASLIPKICILTEVIRKITLWDSDNII